jgi:hypothetical protein
VPRMSQSSSTTPPTPEALPGPESPLEMYRQMADDYCNGGELQRPLMEAMLERFIVLADERITRSETAPPKCQRCDYPNCFCKTTNAAPGVALRGEPPCRHAGAPVAALDLRQVINGHEDGDTYVKVRRTEPSP